MFKLIHKNRKGLSLVELLVCIVILGLVLPLAGKLLYSSINLHNVTVDKWDVQTAVRMACNSFESNSDGLMNAFQVDLIYDPIIDKGVTLKSDGTIEWKEPGYQSCWVMNAEGISVDDDAHKSDVFTYIFSAPTWDENENYLGELLYMRDYGDTNSHLLLDEYGLGDIPVSVTFSMGTTELLDRASSEYTDENIMVHFGSGLEAINYNFDTAIAVVNNARPINYSGGSLVCEAKWMNSDGVTPMAYPAGWDEYYLDTDASGAFVDDNGFPSTTTKDGSTYYSASYVNSSNTPVEVKINQTFSMEVVDDEGNVEKTVTAPVVARQANILRYKSPTAEKTQGTVTEKGTNTNVASCLTGFAMMDSGLKDEVLGNLRMFRDGVLAGTEIGDWIIDQYYYEWSPFLIEHTAFLKPVYKAVLVPVSYVCEFIATL